MPDKGDLHPVVWTINFATKLPQSSSSPCADAFRMREVGTPYIPSQRQEVTVSNVCAHLDEIADVQPSSSGCEDCLRVGGQWVHLRMCMVCGHVGCCDNSPNRHATAHFLASRHPLIQSYEPGEGWWWCYIDEVAFEVEGQPSFSHP
jgi:hypothetical protein